MMLEAKLRLGFLLATTCLLSLCWSAAAQSQTDIPDDVALWRSIQTSSNASLFRDMLERFPHSPLAALARVRFDELKGGSRRADEGRQLPALRDLSARSFATGDAIPSLDEIRRRAVAVAARPTKLLAAPRQDAKPVRSVAANDILTAQNAEGGWLQMTMPGGGSAYVETAAVHRPKLDESFFASVMSPPRISAEPLSATAANDLCLERTSKACLLGLIDSLLKKLSVDDRKDMMARTAASLFNSGHADAAQGYLQQALEIARAATENEYDDANYHRSFALEFVASTLARAGQPRRALEIYSEALFFARIAQSRKDYTPHAEEQAERLISIAGDLGENGLRSQGQAVFAEAIDVIRAIPDSSNNLLDKRIDKFRSLGGARMRVGDVARAFDALSIALNEAARMSYLDEHGFESFKRAQSMHYLASDLAKYGYVDLAASIARSIGRPPQRAAALAKVASLATKVDLNLARKTADEAMQVNQKDRYVAEYLIGGGFVDLGLSVFKAMSKIDDSGRNSIAEALAEVGEFDRAIEIARSIEDEDYYKWAFQDIVRSLFKAGREAEARRLAESVKAFAVAKCVETIADEEGSRINQQISIALSQGAYDQALQIMNASKNFSDSAFYGTAVMEPGKGDRTQLTRLYREIGSDRTQAKLYLLVGLLSATEH